MGEARERVLTCTIYGTGYTEYKLCSKLAFQGSLGHKKVSSQVKMSSDMRVVNFSEARNQLKSVLDQVVEDANCTIISRRDADDAVVMSLDHYNSLMETVHLLKSPANAAHLANSIEQYKNGLLVESDLLTDDQLDSDLLNQDLAKDSAAPVATSEPSTIAEPAASFESAANLKASNLKNSNLNASSSDHD